MESKLNKYTFKSITEIIERKYDTTRKIRNHITYQKTKAYANVFEQIERGLILHIIPMTIAHVIISVHLNKILLCKMLFVARLQQNKVT